MGPNLVLPVKLAISILVVHRSLIDSLDMLSLPVILANVFSSSIEQLKKFSNKKEKFILEKLNINT